MARPSKRYFRDLALLAASGALLVMPASCGETEYNVGEGSPSSSAGTPSQAGRSSAGGGGMANVAGDGGMSAPSMAGRTGVNSGGAAGKPPLVAGNAGRTSSNGGTGSSAGGIFGAAGEPLGGAATTSIGGAEQGGVTAIGGTSAGTAGTSSTAGTGPCGLTPTRAGDRSTRRMLLRDEGVAKLALIDVGNAANSWVVPLQREILSTVQGRDIQLVGNCRVLVGTDIGYEEYDIRTGEKLWEVTSYPNTLSAHRLRNKNTMLVGVGTSETPFQAGVGIVLVEVDALGAFVKKVVYPGTWARLVRQTPTGTFLVANNTKVFEGDEFGTVLTPAFNVATSATTHVWKALRVTTDVVGVSEVVAATGYVANLTFFRADGSIRRTITGGTALVPGGATAVNPYFFADFQLLSNGNYVVANWAGHGPGKFTSGIPILEYNPAGALAWYWGDPTYADRLSGIQGVIVLDGLDPTKLHVEDTNGQQVPVD